MSKMYKIDKFPEPISLEDSLKDLDKESIYKYRLIKTRRSLGGKPLYRIQALKNFDSVKKGDLGGYVHGYHNLSQEGNCWIYDDAVVKDNARIIDDATVRNNAVVSDDAFIQHFAIICDKAVIEGAGTVSHHAVVSDTAVVRDDARVRYNAIVKGNALIKGEADIKDNTVIKDNAVIGGHTQISDFVVVQGDVILDDAMGYCGNAVIASQKDYIVFKNNWSSGRYFMYTFSNRRWAVGCFHGTSQELIERAYEDSKLSGDMYSLYVRLVEDMEKVRDENEK